MKQARILPQLSDENEPFWTGGKEGKLKIIRCQDCGYFIHEPSPMCQQCHSENVAPQTVSGRGTIASFTINHQPWLPDMQVPYVYAIVELPEQEGLRIATNIVNCEPESVAIGDAVTVAFEHYDDVWLPVFEKA